MMEDVLSKRKREFGGPDIESAVELDGVAVDDFAAKPPRQIKGQTRFAGPGRTQYGDQRKRTGLAHVSILLDGAVTSPMEGSLY